MIPDKLLNFFELYFFELSGFLSQVKLLTLCFGFQKQIHVRAWPKKNGRDRGLGRLQTRKEPRAWLKHTSSTVEHGRARSKNTNCPAVIRSHKEISKTNIFMNILTQTANLYSKRLKKKCSKIFHLYKAINLPITLIIMLLKKHIL